MLEKARRRNVTRGFDLSNRLFRWQSLGLWMAVAGLGFGTAIIPSARAMPMFARKYKVDCSMCHAAVPRLNSTGYKFKAAGYRMAWEIGNDQDASVLKLENYTAFVAILDAPLQVQVSQQAPRQTTTTLSVGANEIDVHPITGSFGKYWGSGFELDGLPSGQVSLNQAFVTFTAGSADSFGSAQVGVIPNFLGYGILDRPAAVSTPVVLSQSANDPILDTLFNWANPRAAGLTLSYWTGDTYLSGSIRNRLISTSGGLDALGGSGHMGDILLSVTQFLDHVGSGSALTAFYYKGLSEIPMATGSADFYGNSFNHLGLAVNKYFSDEVNAYAGVAWNADQNYNPTTGSTEQALHSFGTFAGLEYFWSPTLMAGARLDQFRTDLSLPDTEILGGAAYLNWHVINWIILAAEYQYLHSQMNTGFAASVNGGSGSVDDHILTAQATLAF